MNLISCSVILRGISVIILAAMPVLIGQTTRCSFEVEVKSPSQLPVPNADVWLLRSDGTVYAKTQTDEAGIARLYDSPMGGVEIQVGGKLCGAVAVKYLQGPGPGTRHVFVTYERCEGYYVSSGCQFLLRVHNQQGNPIKGARFTDMDLLTPKDPPRSDEFGRFFLFTRFGTAIAGSILSQDYGKADLNLECKPGGPSQIEKIIVLDKK